jgi:hypothetical protein
MIADVDSPESALHAAVVATVAGDVLKGKTLHMALDALSIQQRMEVTAECMFIGTSKKLDVGSRMKDIRLSVDDIVGFRAWKPSNLVRVKATKQRKQRSNAMLEICGELRNVYKEFDQLNEEDQLLIDYRKWELRAVISSPEQREWLFELLGSGGPARKTLATVDRFLFLSMFILRNLFQCLRLYFNFVMRNWYNTIGMSLFWIVAFAAYFWFVSNPHLTATPHRFEFSDYVLQSISNFVSLQPLGGGPVADLIGRLTDSKLGPGSSGPQPLHNLWGAVVTEIVLGYFHLAATIAMFLRRFSRS